MKQTRTHQPLQIIAAAPKWVWHHRVRSILILIGLIVVGLVVRQVATPPKYIKTTIKQAVMTQTVEASGQIVARDNVALSFPAGSKVVWVGVKKGDTVKQWQTLATVDQRELQKEIKKKLLDYMATRWDFEQLQDDNAVHGQPLSAIPLSVSERRILDKSQFGLDQTVLDVEIATLATEQAVMTSPIAGTVIDTANFTPGETLLTADAPTRTIKVANLQTLYFQADVDEADYGKLKPGMKVNLKMDSFPEATLSGTIAFIGKEGVKKTGGSVQIPVDITLNKTDLPLIPELSGDVEIVTYEKPGALILDKQFITQKDTGDTVLVMVKGKPISRQITVGLSNNQTVEVTQGLQAGDTVVQITK